MLALKITDIKDFTNKLFIGDIFDRFWLNEASITTFSTYIIDGKLQQEFFDSDKGIFFFKADVLTPYGKS